MYRRKYRSSRKKTFFPRKKRSWQYTKTRDWNNMGSFRKKLFGFMGVKSASDFAYLGSDIRKEDRVF